MPLVTYDEPDFVSYRALGDLDFLDVDDPDDLDFVLLSDEPLSLTLVELLLFVASDLLF